ncbi:HD domain-containing protein [Candidatus Saccharibacteria bacterium]|nr:HD domain-containing protein [Candidatus Saccharibacteria bacterium]
MINYTQRLDSAIRIAAWAHEQAGQHRKGTDIPYIIHPFGVMTIASGVTGDEDTLIACLLHDILEDVDTGIYSEDQMRNDFGDNVVTIVKDVTKDDTLPDWHAISNAYLDHLQNNACDEAVIVSAADKIHNLQATIIDYHAVGEELWQRFTTKNSADQLWWYESILKVLQIRNGPAKLCDDLAARVTKLQQIVATKEPL